MSSPIRHAEEVDRSLMYAPPRVRKRRQGTWNERAATSTGDGPERLNGLPDTGGDGARVELQDLRNLDPEWVPEPPPDDDRKWWRRPFRSAGVLFFAAAVAWIMMSIPSVRLFLNSSVMGPSFRENLVSGNPSEHFPNTRLVNPEHHISATDGRESGNTKQFTRRVDQAATVAPTQSTPIAKTPAAPSAPITSDFVTRHLDPEELASLRLHADNFIKSDDLSSARLLLERAAEAGDGRAALTLAGTFDPNELKTLGFHDGAADVAMARVWYERAETFGSAEARDRLQLLATASPH